MKLILRNGYPFPFPADLEESTRDQICEAAGGVTLELEGVQSFETLHTYTVAFESEEAFQKAREITGWDVWSFEGLILEARPEMGEGYLAPGIATSVPYDGAVKSTGTAFAGFHLIAQ